MSKIRDKTGKFIKAQTNEEKFWEKVNIRNNGCWEWLAQKDKDGYGTFMLSSNKGQKRTRAHRYSWVLHFGDVPKEKFVLHKCDNPPCINPNHLFLGTAKDNTQDMVKKHRYGYNNIGGENHPNAKLNNQKVKQIKELWNSKQYTQIELGRMFDVGNKQINLIINNKAWKNVE